MQSSRKIMILKRNIKGLKSSAIIATYLTLNKLFIDKFCKTQESTYPIHFVHCHFGGIKKFHSHCQLSSSYTNSGQKSFKSFNSLRFIVLKSKTCLLRYKLLIKTFCCITYSKIENLSNTRMARLTAPSKGPSFSNLNKPNDLLKAEIEDNEASHYSQNQSSDSDSDEAPEEVSLKSSSDEVKKRLQRLKGNELQLRKAEREKRRLQNERNRERNAQRVSASKLDLAILEAAEVEEINSTTEIEEKVDEASLDLYTPKGHKIVFPNNEIPKKRTRSFRKGDFKVSVLKETNDPLLAPNYEKKLSQRKRDWINRQSVPRASKRRRPLTY
ncbi:U3 snoRNP-associated protein Utp16 [Schizosaccharomyces pombe]|uniref:U3 small nucleolar RNA-associated protein 16 n=1 Tax=Schizosaccharomyces pombe (strain 972 / ATCC 24843) TaxID=284812 RepID=UTP16_SCHPO|nr:putative U3 snoRNP-associated protein Utp16 [Schizosaccharomyces pombe]O94259.2 RecName: Full=Probable U3 small nucleolar RNA-associated protein 16; Short=U3 snoRNA-associated protein 16 [Schizosaccharomyces pombe 972h-]CAA21795.2 U3 snoRNP-associated protein Utp16 (predicted) [Schizosaccharomyces pombe]|eukprot:NP_596517.2 putative U3 snoRNP-associated protein Utp16 [Schizosaccharomyces pombe]